MAKKGGGCEASQKDEPVGMVPEQEKRNRYDGNGGIRKDEGINKPPFRVALRPKRRDPQRRFDRGPQTEKAEGRYSKQQNPDEPFLGWIPHDRANDKGNQQHPPGPMFPGKIKRPPS